MLDQRLGYFAIHGQINMRSLGRLLKISTKNPELYLNAELEKHKHDSIDNKRILPGVTVDILLH